MKRCSIMKIVVLLPLLIVMAITIVIRIENRLNFNNQFHTTTYDSRDIMMNRMLQQVVNDNGEEIVSETRVGGIIDFIRRILFSISYVVLAFIFRTPTVVEGIVCFWATLPIFNLFPSPTNCACNEASLRHLISSATTTSTETTTITICPDTYQIAIRNPIDITGKNIFIDGERPDGVITEIFSGPSSSPSRIFALNRNHRILYGTTSTTKLHMRDIIFQDGLATIDDDDDGNGGAIYITGGGYVTCEECQFINNRAEGNGGAISVSGNATIELSFNFLMENNIANGNGGAVFATDSSNVRFIGYGDVVDSQANIGGAVHIEGKSTFNTDDMTFSNNVATTNGAAISVTGGSTAEIVRNDFISNQASGKGGAIFASEGSTVTMEGLSEVRGCQAELGGAVYIEDDSNFKSTNGMSFQQNEHTMDMSGALHFVDSTATFNNTNIQNSISTAMVVENSKITYESAAVLPGSGEISRFFGNDIDIRILDDDDPSMNGSYVRCSTDVQFCLNLDGIIEETLSTTIGQAFENTNCKSVAQVVDDPFFC